MLNLVLNLCEKAPDAVSMTNVQFNQYAGLARGAIPLIQEMKRKHQSELNEDLGMDSLSIPQSLDKDSYLPFVELKIYQEILGQVNRKNFTYDKIDNFIPAWDYLASDNDWGISGALHPNKFGDKYDEDRCLINGQFASKNLKEGYCVRRNQGPNFPVATLFNKETIMEQADSSRVMELLKNNMETLNRHYWPEQQWLQMSEDPLYYSAICFNSKIMSQWLREGQNSRGSSFRVNLPFRFKPWLANLLGAR